MIRRRKFFATVMSCVCWTSTMGVVGFVGGCGDSSESPAPPNPKAETQVQESRKAMLDFLAKKKATPKKR